MISERDKKILEALIQFTDWLEKFGEISQDHQDFYASWIGRYSKKLYYKSALLGKVVVAPAVFCEAFLPFTRKLFHPPMRLPISDAHFAMGFAMMYKLLKKEAFLKKCKHFLDVLEKTRCVKFKNYCWGYPFDWQTKGGTIPQGTPLITTTPYGYEAFELAYDICPDEKWLKVMRSVADHALYDIDDKEIATDTNSCAYYPNAGYLVINASSYRAGLLCKAFKRFNSDEYLVAARKNVNFVIQSQNKDGSWPYA
ncbi:MAG: hypothetical protein GX640_13260, partial [Fibrobacter sp.]|nr:hypothetical protein [Fibrobacter sp.]